MLQPLARAISPPTPPLHDPLPGRPDPQNSLLLLLTQPHLLRLPQHTLTQIINKMPNHNQHKRNRIQKMHTVSKHLDADNHAPEVSGQETDIEEGG